MAKESYTIKELQEQLREAQLRAEAAEQQQRREREQREAAEQRAEASEQQTRPTTLDEYLDACHDLVFTKLQVEQNPGLVSKGSLTNPQSKWCPTELQPWPEFLQHQRRIFGLLLDAFPCDSDRLFESKNFLGTMGARIGKRSIADEKGLEFFLHNAVEDPVRNIVDQLVQSPIAKETFDLGGGIVFENHPHALSDIAEEVVDKQTRPAPPSTPGHGENLKKLQADQICVYRSDATQGSRTRAFICEYKPPNKLTVQHLHVGLQVRDIYKEVVNRKTIPTSEDPEARFKYHAEKLTASAITQTYHYMIEGGLEYSLLTTGEAIVFLKVDWREPGTLFYHMAVPSIEVAAQTMDARLCTAVAQYLAFTLLAIDGLGTRWQDERDRATKELNKWEVSFESTYQSIPEQDRSFFSDSSLGYQPPTYGNVDRSPVRRRKNPPRGQGPAHAGIPPRRDDRSESSDEEPNPRAPGTPTPSQRNTRQGARRSERLAMRPRGGGADNSNQRRPFCTQKCLLGLVRGHALDHSCPNISRHCQGKTHSGRGAIRHPIDHAEWLQLLRAQLKETLDRGITPLEKGGARGVLFKVTLLEYGYTFVSKGTIKAFIPDLEHEAAVYRRLEDIQGIYVPVFLGAVDLRSLHRTYYYDHRVYIVHLTLMSWGGESLHEGRGRMPTTEEQVKRGLHALHQHGVIHKDVRAPNILFCEETGKAMLVDFERAELPEPPRPPLAKMASNKRLLSDVPGERKRRKSRQGTIRFSEDILMARSLFITTQLRNSSPPMSQPIGASSALRRPAQTPSSPLVRCSSAAATEGAQPEPEPYRLNSIEPLNLQPVSIVDGANKVAQEQTDAYNAKLAVFQAFCESFDQAAKQFTSGIEHSFTEQFANSFLDFWRQSLSILPPAPPAPTYSSVVAGRTAHRPPGGNATTSTAAPPPEQQQTTVPRFQGRPIPAPPREDLRVFVRLDAEAPARNHGNYAIRTHIAAKVGIDLQQIPAAFPVNSGWAIRTADAATRDLIVQRQSEWADDLGAKSVEVSKKWYTYVVSNCPRRLTDLQGNEADYDAAVKDEIACQTNLTPISIRPSRHDSNDLPSKTLIVSFLEPTKKPWRLFGSSRLARYIDKPAVPTREQTYLSFQEATHRPHRARSMTRHPRTQQSGKKTLRIFQANVGKIPPAHDCALALADSERYDVVLLQEPWTEAKGGRCLTKTHPAYDTFSPVDSWEDNSTRPRVMTYVRRRPGLMVDQRRPAATRDILWLVVNDITLVNIYRQPLHDEALDILLQWSAPDRCLVAGDFNAKHHSWQAGRTEGRGEAVAEWATANGLNLLNPADIPTNPHGNTIDLAFSNIGLADAVVEDHLATSSDHFTLNITLPELAVASPPTGKVRLTSEEEIRRFVEMVENGAAAIQPSTASPQDLDSLALAVTNLLKSAAKAAGRPVRKGARSAPWWTEECALAAAEYRAVRRVFPLGFCREVQLAKRSFQRVVRRVKRRYWRDLIDSFTDSASVCKAVRWLRSPGAFQPPPLQVDDIVYETQLDKANALRRATLERRTSQDDIADPWIPVITRRTIPFAQSVSLEEVRDATLRTGNTSPGSDNITVKMLRAVWHVIGNLVHKLFQGCLNVGHHPKPFREAEVVMITKPGRRNLSEARAWRPISLLSCLGKGLERLIARRLAWASVHHGVLHPQQAGALPKRSAVDLVAALVHDIEEAFARNMVATVVTLDAEGAFDTVLQNRLILRLRQQGWPPNVARWAGSLMHDRSACVRYQDVTTPSSPLQCGLPQGSPASPILYLLYTEPIYRLRNLKGRFGYADDTAILCVGNTLEETARKASRHVRDLVDWGTVNAITFDHKKTEVMHFSRTKLRSAPPVFHGEVKKRPESALRWLGIWLDSTLTFKTHVEKWTAKAAKVAHHLKGMANTNRGPLPSAVRRAVRACIEPQLLFGAEAWYPGMTCPRWTQPAKEGPSGIRHLIRRMDKSLHTAVRAVLPIWKTTPLSARHREAGIPPVSQLLESCRLRFAARLRSLDEAHPLVARTKPMRAPVINRAIKLKYQLPRKPFRTRLRRSDELLPRCARPELLPQRFASDQPLQTALKEESAAKFRDWLQSVEPGTAIVYSDGSLSPEGAAGYGYAIHLDGLTVLAGNGRLGPAEVFDAEAKGALEGLRAALGLSEPERIVVCLDNLAVAKCLQGMPSDSSQKEFMEFQALAAEHGATEIRWIPGHTNIPGNEQADALAKAGTSQPEPVDALPTLAYLRKVARRRPKDAFKAWWEASAPQQYRVLDLDATTGCPPELTLPRPLLHHLLAARTHHGDFADYHERFKHEDARLTCSCGRQKEPKHLFYCRKIPPRHRMRLAPSPTAAVNRAIGRDFDQFVKVAKASSFFGTICPRH
ncbi:Protein phosphatase 1 regulatory subunit 3A [Purpureocillium lavendulum]|uniref:Protein phosphatase 1 regulatory subunit 3A n=1 Tax=Purpureocillium lavendulum TaxID=1247861 RepID=A0AB34FDL7_9HYPO|nr:Protein phosphatase 1 regulatory subunit 3A [Purpureocillium lavendulum]